MTPASTPARNPFEFALFLRHTEGLVLDVMLQAKVKDLALLRLRRDLPRYAPDQALQFGPEPVAGAGDE